ncbi:MAG: N-acetyl-gamma-glutamyl-phosphate reductase [Lachnospiraceae bacterium]|nr:N-acetyl-gamma-glutamyl-phosphate reductase [Lachnospiraceae bacterium]
MSKVKVFINGSEGTTGLRILERFENRDDVDIIPIASELRKDPATVAGKINESDITFFCLPDAAAVEALTYVKNPETKIIDASTAHRTLPGWSYGFPELSEVHREGIVTGKRVAVPGCHASGFISLVYPLVAGGILPKDALLSCTSISGYSGAGKKTIAVYEDRETRAGIDPDPLCSPRQYALAQAHKHLKEMKAIPGLSHEPVFLPYICDFYCGMLVTVPLHKEMFAKSCTLKDLQAYFEEYYAGKQFIKVLPEGNDLVAGNFLPVNTLKGYDGMEILIYGNDERPVVSARFDNLGKGASGAAIQCMNLMTGADEAKGLNLAR